jgi:hypothetical protein
LLRKGPDDRIDVAGRQNEIAGNRRFAAAGGLESRSLRTGRGPMRMDSTFSEAGGVALWTEADSVTRFERIAITPML